MSERDSWGPQHWISLSGRRLVCNVVSCWVIYLPYQDDHRELCMCIHKSLNLQTMMGECCNVGRFRKHLQVSWGFSQSSSDSVWLWEAFLLLVFILLLNFSPRSSHFFHSPFVLVLLQYTTKLQLLSLHISNSCADLQAQSRLKESNQKILEDTNICVILSLCDPLCWDQSESKLK